MTFPPRPPTPPHLRRYGWYRRYSGFVAHKKWRAVARMTGLHITVVIAVVDALLEGAHDGRPRGSLSGFSVVEWGASLDLEPAVVKCVYDALEELGWIENEYIVTWDERQPDKEDATAKDRMRRMRAKIKGQRLSTGYAVTSVTSRPDQTRVRQASEPVNCGDNAPEWPISATQWLREDGLAIVCRQGKLLQSRADLVISRWRRDLDHDDAVLRDIITACAGHAREGQFVSLVSEGVARHRQEVAKGSGLPWGPVRIRTGEE